MSWYSCLCFCYSLGATWHSIRKQKCNLGDIWQHFDIGYLAIGAGRCKNNWPYIKCSQSNKKEWANLRICGKVNCGIFNLADEDTRVGVFSDAVHVIKCVKNIFHVSVLYKNESVVTDSFSWFKSNSCLPWSYIISVYEYKVAIQVI